MALKVSFPGKKKVNAEYHGFTIETDQPKSGGGDASAPAPFDLFLASIATCSGVYVKSFCDSRDLSAEGITLEQRVEYNREKGKIDKVLIEIKVPEDFPDKYYDALIRSVDQCAVKKTIQDPPEFDIKTLVNS